MHREEIGFYSPHFHVFCRGAERKSLLQTEKRLIESGNSFGWCICFEDRFVDFLQEHETRIKHNNNHNNNYNEKQRQRNEKQPAKYLFINSSDHPATRCAIIWFRNMPFQFLFIGVAVL